MFTHLVSDDNGDDDGDDGGDDDGTDDGDDYNDDDGDDDGDDESGQAMLKNQHRSKQKQQGSNRDFLRNCSLRVADRDVAVLPHQ